MDLGTAEKIIVVGPTPAKERASDERAMGLLTSLGVESQLRKDVRQSVSCRIGRPTLALRGEEC